MPARSTNFEHTILWWSGLQSFRAGFTLSRALFWKNVGPFNWGGRPYFFWKKTGDLFSHHRPCVSCQFFSKTGALFCSSFSFHSGIAHLSGIQKFATLFVGPMFGRTCWTCLNPPLKIANAKFSAQLDAWSVGHSTVQRSTGRYIGFVIPISPIPMYQFPLPFPIQITACLFPFLLDSYGKTGNENFSSWSWQLHLRNALTYLLTYLAPANI